MTKRRKMKNIILPTVLVLFILHEHLIEPGIPCFVCVVEGVGSEDT
jgi:hypothetical protein